ncbi:murein hydrolase activator EnvC family protein [Herbaspirillum rubrisubalbicans]|uniref:Protease n=1 Tax=Herbaspirillum rubrisubalbicans TaxID=80842 RepID=A0AAD0U572_9BURK|nr:peptidoglycan DD-metalloendopeptidase family protein [Herbaspirillum rubrisubalbicans]AYR22456.1 protease [Herbaspirillum rubrisubalbicans]
MADALRGCLRALAAIGVGCLLCAAVQAQPITERTKQKQAAEKEQADLQQRLANLKRDIDKTETAKDNAADALSASEQAISKANRSLRDLAQEQQATEARLAQLVKQLNELTALVNAQQAQLSKLLREQYVAGNEDRIKLLLSGDNPNRINRELQYMGYVSQAQAKLIETLRANQQAIRANKADTQNAKFELEEIAQEELEQKKVLEREKGRRQTLLSQLSTKLNAQRQEAGRLEQDQQRLSSLVDKLAQIIEQQKKAEAEAREKRRQEQLAKAKAEREKRLAEQRARAEKRAAEAAKAAKEGKPAPKTPDPADAIDDDEPPQSASLGRNDTLPEPSDNFGKPFASLRGQLHLPVKGELVSKFGSRRGDGPTSRGLFIRAQEGSEVRAVAAGRVVFADWLRGFGNLIIVDHGNQYMTIYGNNQSVLKRAGDLVKAGETIATAGNSGGNEQSGLYFEMRYQGRAFDPLGWVTSR